MRKTISVNIPFTLFILSIALGSLFAEYGDPGWTFDESLYDSRYPDMKEWANAGVEGGIPFRNSLKIKKELSADVSKEDMSGVIQAAIDEVASNGGGVVLLKNGKYPIKSTFTLKSNVVLRGEDRMGVTLSSTIRGGFGSSTIKMDNCTRAGLEDLTVFYIGIGEPKDKENVDEGPICRECYVNIGGGLSVSHVQINGGSNNWIDHCRFLNAGTDPLLVIGSHHTLRKNFIDRSYCKGEEGNGYYDFRGVRCLMVKDTVKRIRHLSVQQGTSYSMIFKCHIEVDVNFHNKDKGHNLVEQNTIHVAAWHPWGVFMTGVPSAGHSIPGPQNVLYNNDNKDVKNPSKIYSGPEKIYTFTGYRTISEMNGPPPKSKTFYPVKSTGTPTEIRRYGNKVSESSSRLTMENGFPVAHLSLKQDATVRATIASLSGRILFSRAFSFQLGNHEIRDFGGPSKIETGLYIVTVAVNGDQPMHRNVFIQK